MPQATSARNTDRDRLPRRPSAAVRGASAETAPVLFRLPVIVQPPSGVAEAKPVLPPTAQAQTTAVATDPLPVSFAVDLPPPGTGASMSAVSAAKPTAADTASAPAESKQQTLAGTDDVAAVSFPSVQPARATAAAEYLEPATQHAPSSRVAQPAESLTPSVHRSWWEHWSSGVVLILLIIALVTASILALNDGGQPNKEQLASESVSAALDDFDLSNITIPDIAVHKSEPSAEVGQAVSGDGSDSSAAKADTAVAVAAEKPAAEADPASKLPEAVVAATKSDQSSGAMAALAPPANANLTVAPLTSPTKTAAKQSADTAAPLASLALPVGVSQAPLFEAKNSPAAERLSNASGSFPGVTASAVTPPANTNTTADIEKAMPPTPAESGASPQLYDGAGMGIELHATRRETADANSHGAGPVDTALPSYATILASATGPVSAGSAAPRDTTATTPTASPAATGTAQQQLPPGIISTATPELDTQAIINAYLPYSQTYKANNGAATNRFAPAGGVPAAGQSPASTPASLPGSRGFTLGN